MNHNLPSYKQDLTAAASASEGEQQPAVKTCAQAPCLHEPSERMHSTTAVSNSITCKDLLLEVNALNDSLHHHVHILEFIIAEGTLQLGQQLVHLLLIHLAPFHLAHQVGLDSAQPSLPGAMTVSA